MVKVELTYNPYIPRLSITLDGREPDPYSRLIQYCDEPIWSWYDCIVHDLDAELRREFAIEFVGLPTHAALIRRSASECSHCIEFIEFRFEIDTPINIRMGKLNQLLKVRRGMQYRRVAVSVVFAVSDTYKSSIPALESLSIANEYCQVSTRVLKLPNVDARSVNSDDYVILVSDNDAEANRFTRESCPFYMARCGIKDSITGMEGGGLIVTTGRPDVFDAVTTCLLDAPLTDAYVRCLSSIGERLPQDLRAIEPTVKVELNDKIELQRSSRITLVVTPEGKRAPRVQFKVVDERVASSDGLAVFGKSVGKTTLEAYYVGESTPFQTVPIEVYKRNRITELLLSNRSFSVGIGSRQRIGLEYVPKDADNVSSIRWASTRPEIAAVSQDGTVIARGKGVCDIIVSAEGITAKCRCVAMPYLEELTITLPLVKDDDGSYLMSPMQEVTMEILKVPNESIDGNLEVKSSAYDVANVVGTKVVAKNPGEATVYVSNSTGSKTVTLKVRVNKQRQQQKLREQAAERERERRAQEREERKRAKAEKRERDRADGKRRFFGLFE